MTAPVTDPTIQWMRSQIRKERFYARFCGKKLVVENVGTEWVLTEDKKRRAGCRPGPNAAALLREIAEQHYVERLNWQQALVTAESLLWERMVRANNERQMKL